MVLRGQGDSPVRICEPCKKLEEAARFEMRYGRRAGRGSLKSAPKDEDEILTQILGQNEDLLLSSGKQSTSDKGRSGQRSVGVASSSSTKGFSNHDDVDVQKIVSNERTNTLGIDVGSTTPDELRQQALAEKSKYKILKGDGKSEEALRAFKRGKELERQADALEIQLRKARKKLLPSGNMSDMHNRDIPVESGRKTKSLTQIGKDKDDLTSELRELGWSDVDLHKEDRKSANLSLEGELSSLVGETFAKTGEVKGSGIDKTEVVAMKKKALTLKREGKLAEAKEELKRAKILEKQLEEQELLADAEDSDDELSALIRGMDNDDKEFSNVHGHEHGFDFDNLLGISDNLDGNLEVTDEDMMDPELAVALESLGWTEPENTFSKSQTFDKKALLSEIQSLKREAVNQKRAGNTEEAMAILKKAKLLERDFNNIGSDDNDGSDSIQLDEKANNATNNAASTVAPKSRLMIQRELLNLKKKALTLRREGKMNEAEEEMRKGAVLEHQLLEMDNAPSHKSSLLNTDNVLHAAQRLGDMSRNPPVEEGNEDDVTDKDMSDPTYLSLLTDLGWNDDKDKPSNSSSKLSKKYDDNFIPIDDTSLSKHSTNVLFEVPRRSNAEIQRELLSLKRKALALRREGKAEDAEEVLKMAKTLEAKIEEMDALKNNVQVEATMKKELFNSPVETAIDEERDVVVSEEDMHDPALNSLLTNLGWKDDSSEPGIIKNEPVKEATSRFKHTVDPSALNSSSDITVTASRNKGEIQRELLQLKRKALALRRKGEIDEAEEILRMAKNLETQMEDFESQERHGSWGVAAEVDNTSASSVVGSLKNDVESAIGLERIDDKTNVPFSRKPDNLGPATSHFADDKHPIPSQSSVSSENLAKRMKVEKIIGHSSSTGHSMHMPDLLTGDGCSSSEILSQKQKEEYKVGSANSSQVGPTIHLDSSVNLSQEQIYKNNIAAQRRKEVNDVDQKPNTSQSNADLDNASQDDLSLRQEILALKRKAVALKREGKLTEAREDLRQAKLLEKRLEEGNRQPNIASTSNVSNASNAMQKKQDSSNSSVKPLTSRDRFKLQQESLAHKRQALKLRREGRTEEAEAEFERAKAIETQLEELSAHDANKSDAVDDVTIEDFLDPQLLSALKAVGLEDVGVVSKKSPEKQETVKKSIVKIDNSNQEKIQLEERVKEEKLKAVSLKRSGKQAEALDALRRAKMYEKKLNSLTSG